jgi:hypothetical protein
LPFLACRVVDNLANPDEMRGRPQVMLLATYH